MPADRKTVAGYLVLLILIAPLTTADIAPWDGPSSVDTQGGTATIQGFEVPGNATVLDAWVHVSDSPMDGSSSPAIVWDSDVIANGTMAGTTMELVDGYLSMEDDLTRSEISSLDEGNYTIDLSSTYTPGPHPLVMTQFQSPGGYTPHAHCNNLSGYNLSSGFDEDNSGDLSNSEITSSHYLCQTSQVVQGGNGRVANGTLVNGSFMSSEAFLAAGNTTCPEGGKILTYGNDYGYYYDDNNGLNATEEDGELLFCNRQVYWSATNLELNGAIQGSEQTLSHGVVPASASEGSVAIGTLPGDPLPADTDTWFSFSVGVLPHARHSNYTLSYDLWNHLDGSEGGAWLEYQSRTTSGWGQWTWIEPEGGYPYSISHSNLSVTGAPTGALPVYGGTSHSGWISDQLNLSTIPGASVDTITDLKFRFRVWTSENSTPRPGLFVDNILVHNDGTGGGAWHHGCDVNGYSFANHNTYCYYSNNANGHLQTVVNLTNVDDLIFTLHWDLEGSVWDNACIEISNNGGTNWIDISSTGGTSTASQCRSRTGPIPGSGYTDMNGNTHLDDSAGPVDIQLSVPASHRVSNAQLKITVQTDGSVQYGNSNCSPFPCDPDGREGLTVYSFRGMDSSGAQLFFRDMGTASVTTYATGTNEWRLLTMNSGYLHEPHGFEDSSASEPEAPDATGFQRGTSVNNCQATTCQFVRGAYTDAGNTGEWGPARTSSYPYSYAIGSTGTMTSVIGNAWLMTPTYNVSQSGITEFVFDHWICMTWSNYIGGALFIQVNGGSWQHYDPGTYTNTMYSFGSTTALDGLGIWTTVHCGTDELVSESIDLSAYRGDEVRFRFIAAAKYSDTDSGWFIDNIGLRQANFSSSGTWLSQEFQLGADGDLFDFGIIEALGTAYDYANNTLTGTLLDSNSMEAIPGYSDVDFPISLAGLDVDSHPQLRLKLSLDSQNPVASPMVKLIRIGGPRILWASMGGINGWDISNGIELIDDALNATSITGTITSDYLHSQRPIKGLSFTGNSSSNVYVEVFDADGNSLGANTKGSAVSFATPQTGYALEISLPTNGFINTLSINHDYGEPARDPSIDAAVDGSIDWSFPSSLGRGHYAWQTKLIPDSSIGSSQGEDSVALSVDSSGTSIYSIVPVSSYVNSGLVSISSDADGFESPVSVSFAGSSFSTGSADELFTTTLSASQLSAINSLSAGWTDPDTNRDWRIIQISITSNSQQFVKISGLALGYTIFENVSGLGGAISDYHDANSQDDPPPEDISIPFEFSSASGTISVDGDIVYSYFVTNRDFQVPNTLYPDGNSIEIVTKHHHLTDNSVIASISLTGSGSDGEVIEFSVENNPDGLWGQGSPVSFAQGSGSSVAPLDISASFVEVLLHSDGFIDVVVHWVFEVNWNWDDVSTIQWTAKAMIDNGDTVWPATATSGLLGAKAVENDIQVDTFVVRDGYGRLLSNQFSTFYPLTIKHGSDVNVSGNLRFQDSQSHRPQSDDFSVGLNLSGNLFSLSSGENGSFSGIISPPSSLSELSLSPIVINVGPSGAIGAEDTSGSTPQVIVRIDANPPTVGPIEIGTDIGLQPANGKVWEPTSPISVFVTSDEAESRGDEITLRYWREGVDDLNMDGVADEHEYMAIPMPLSSGLTGEQQIQFPGVDVSGVPSNGVMHMYIEGTDWAGNSYQDGNTGGGPGADNAWSSVVIATDEPTSLVSSGFNMDREIGYLLAGVPHVFSLQINEPNGIQTLDNVTVMLCGDGPSNLGKFSFNPSRGTLWSAEDSMVIPLSAQSSPVDSDVTLLSLGFELSWDYPWEEGQLGCKPGVSIEDDLNTVAYINNLAELSWELDNTYMAVPDLLTDTTPPIIDMTENSLYLRQGDEFAFEGSIVYAGSQVVARSIPNNLQVEVEVIYGTQEVDVVVDVNPDGSFSGSMILPSRVPLIPEMSITTTVLNIPGLGTTMINSDYSVTVDSKPPQALFNLAEYPDSSLTILDSDLIGAVTVTVTMVDEIGMTDGPIQVSWVYIRSNAPVAETEDSGELPMIIDGDTNDVYQGILDLSTLNGMDIEPGDQIWFWITSTDKSGNEVVGSGSDTAPRQVTVRIMEFLGDYTRSVVNPTMNPTVGEILTIETFWENPGKRDGELTVGLYELVDGEQWIESLSTNRDGLVTISLPAESSSVYTEFEWESWQSGQPNLYLIVDEDFDNPYQAITGINVKAPVADDEDEADSQIMLFGGIAAVAIIVVAMLMSRGRGDEDFYYEDDDESYYDEKESWEPGEEEPDEDEPDEDAEDDDEG
ncbi:MAG: hypothetical protein VX204_02440 [Candidatus Thermoplasmatota archaeon]|nr:hypothetical protein [Candidatus Thermoplasmatota archaeon]